MKYLKYGVNYVINYHIRKKSPPLIAGLAVTCKCNLRCRHCRVTNRGVENTRYEEIIDVIDTFYNKAQLEEFCEYINKISQIHGIFCLLNSRAGIISALKNNWKRPLDICHVYEI
jgi:MoaA/NifB/PqqE/SkfB family radical SAM enzyme